jgi:SAM-dependent methyltransferase
MKKTEFIAELENFVRNTADNCFVKIGTELEQNSISLAQLKFIDYMRYAEFSAVGQWISLEPNQRILDVSSPQWFSIFLAHKYPDVSFEYINIIDIELETYKQICEVAGIENIKYIREDVRSLSYQDATFDKVISISVLEHIYPEVGGDLQALTEIKRVLKPEGEILLTVPYKDKRNTIYIDGSVYERESQEKTFFAREYDREMFEILVRDSGFSCREIAYICERVGILSVDYYQWGPGKLLWYANYITKLKQAIEKIFGRDIDGDLAQRYLEISTDESVDRVVNVVAALEN